jgi:hypothetical protein
MLRAFVELVLNVASTFRMKTRRVPVNATPTAPLDLPRTKTDTHQETTAARQSSPIALILSSARSARPSKDEVVLTTPSVSLGSRQAIHLPQCFALMEATQRTVATKGNCLHHSQSGGGGLRALARKTEGALHLAPTPNKSAPSAHNLTP